MQESIVVNRKLPVNGAFVQKENIEHFKSKIITTKTIG
jgi:hypothetical protein